MPPQKLRPYQAGSVLETARAFKAGARKVLIVVPTGGGKTSIFCFFIHKLNDTALILVHRRELAEQAAKRLKEFGVDYGVIMAGKPERPYAQVQIASVQTLIRRLRAGKKLPRARIIVNDEAHLSTAASWEEITNAYPDDTMILGVTATPWRLGGKPLAKTYDRALVGARPRELRELGFLCDYSGFSYLTPDLSKVRTMAGDYNEADSAEAMRQPAIVANILEQWQAHASSLSTLLFAVNVEHSKELCAQFVAAGVRAEHLDGKTPHAERERIMARVASGFTRVLCNVGVAVEGLDIPRIKCIILARPTKSVTWYLQATGRSRRRCKRCSCGEDYVPDPPLKPSCPKCRSTAGEWLSARIHDHAFLIRKHGLPDQDRDYSLDAKPEKPPPIRVCEKCFASFEGIKCPSCAHENEPAPLGERVLVTVDDAEQFSFESGEEKPLEPMFKPARKCVRVDWRTKLNKPIEGVYLEKRREDTELGGRWFHKVDGGSKDYLLPGAAVLDRQLAGVPLQSKIRVTYTGEEVIGDFFSGKRRKTFLVEVDDGT